MFNRSLGDIECELIRHIVIISIQPVNRLYVINLGWLMKWKPNNNNTRKPRKKVTYNQHLGRKLWSGNRDMIHTKRIFIHIVCVSNCSRLLSLIFHIWALVFVSFFKPFPAELYLSSTLRHNGSIKLYFYLSLLLSTIFLSQAKESRKYINETINCETPEERHTHTPKKRQFSWHHFVHFRFARTRESVS